jgi:hypothetical protein
LTALSAGARTQPRGWQTFLLTWKPFDGWLILLVGLVIVGVGIFHFYLAATRRFVVDLLLERMSRRVKKMTLACGVAGHAGRGLAFLITGAFLAYAGWYVEEIEARGFGDALRTFETQRFGWWVMIAVAVGLIAYGVYLLLAAWYLRLIATW